MRPRLALGFSLVVLSAGAWLACGTDSFTGSSSDAGGIGGENEPCYANHTCDDGLTCASNVCVRLGDGGSADASSDGGDIVDGNASDGPDPFCNADIATGAQLPDKVYCPIGGGGAQRCTITTDSGAIDVCCAEPSSGTCPNKGSPCDTTHGTQWQCGRPADCDVEAGELCCATIVSDVEAGACIEHAVVSQSSCFLGCGGDLLPLCTSTADCASGSCLPLEVTFNQTVGTTVVGACR